MLLFVSKTHKIKFCNLTIKAKRSPKIKDSTLSCTPNYFLFLPVQINFPLLSLSGSSSNTTRTLRKALALRNYEQSLCPHNLPLLDLIIIISDLCTYITETIIAHRLQELLPDSYSKRAFSFSFSRGALTRNLFLF